MSQFSRIYSLVPSALRRRLPRVVLSSLCSAVVDLVGIAALVSVLLVVLDDNITSSNPLFAWLYQWLGFGSESAFVTFVCLAVLVLIALKGVVGVALQQYRSCYMLMLYADLSKRMYDNYLSRGLLFVRSHHTTRLVNNVNAVCHRFAAGVISTLLGVFTELLVVVTLLVLLSFYNPMIVILAVVVFVPIALIYSRVIRRRMAENGREENRLQVAQNKTMYEALRGYADIEIAGAKPSITKRFANGIDSLRYYSLRASRMRSAASYVIEFSLVLGVVAVILLGMAWGHSVGTLKLFLGVFAVAAYRIVPSINRIMGGWTEYKRNGYVVDLLAEELAVSVPEIPQTKEKLPFEESIELRDVSFGYGGDEAKSVLENFSLLVRKGERVGIQGSSGRGKTTLFNLLSALFIPTKGELRVDGKPIETPLQRRQWQNNVAYVSQDLFIPDQTIAENIALGVERQNIDPERLQRAIRAARLDDFVASLPEGVDTVTGEAGCRLSGGQRQRIGIARALYKEASVLMFDEATSSLDEQTEREVVEAVAGISEANRSLTIVVISHNSKTLDFCDRIITL
ncbi:MAG: ABC transporter ATP-binding protein [Tidjanibacter sp.]|nr:ABC transporter ATP-binding protein [Tidjanibacter sp.]